MVRTKFSGFCPCGPGTDSYTRSFELPGSISIFALVGQVQRDILGAFNYPGLSAGLPLQARFKFIGWSGRQIYWELLTNSQVYRQLSISKKHRKNNTNTRKTTPKPKHRATGWKNAPKQTRLKKSTKHYPNAKFSHKEKQERS